MTFRELKDRYYILKQDLSTKFAALLYGTSQLVNFFSKSYYGSTDFWVQIVFHVLKILPDHPVQLRKFHSLLHFYVKRSFRCK